MTCRNCRAVSPISRFPPNKMVGGAAALIEEVAATKISGEEERYKRKPICGIFRPTWMARRGSSICCGR